MTIKFTAVHLACPFRIGNLLKACKAKKARKEIFDTHTVITIVETYPNVRYIYKYKIKNKFIN